MRIGGYDKRAMEYVHECLSAGFTLAKKLNEKEISANDITCFLPKDLEDARKHNFKIGGVSGNSWSHRKANAELIQLVQGHLASSDTAVAVIENREMALDSKFLGGLPFVHFGNEIYLLLDHGQALNEALVRDTLKAGTRYPFIMVLTSDHGKKSPEDNAVDAQTLERWVREASHIVVGVYDEESYLICKAR